MAVTNKNSEQFVLELFRAEHNLLTDSLVFCLMNDSFVFDPATHSTYSDISTSEIAGTNGYTQKTKAVTISGIAVTNGIVVVSCDNPTWTAAGGAIENTAACCVVNTTHANETVVCCCEFGAAYATADTKQFQINFVNGLTQGTPNP